MSEQNLDVASENANETTVTQLMQLNYQRDTTYGLLARLYRSEIDADTLHELCSMRFPADTGNDKATEGYYLLATFLCNIWDNTLNELSVDYARVFIGHGNDANSAAYPYESVYTSSKRLMMQNARDEVLSIYRSVGLDKQEQWKEGEDHIAVELEFEQYLCEKINEALDAGNQDRAASLLSTQRNFLKNHLVSWVPLMTREIRHFAKTDFYLALASLTEGFLEIEQGFLDDIVLNEGD